MSYITLYTMKVYFILGLIFIGVCLNQAYGQASRQRVYLLFEAAIFLILAGVVAYDLSLRPSSTVGDTSAYFDFYRDLAACGFDDGLEAAFVLLSKILIYFGFTHVALFWIVPFVVIASYYILTKVLFGKESMIPVVLVSIFIFYPFFWSFSANVIRQGFAVAFLTLCLSMLVLGRQWVACMFLVLACLFHKSALIFLPFVIFLPLFVNVSLVKVFTVWAVVSLLSFTGMFSIASAFIFGQLAALDFAANYSNFAADAYLTGFRWKFWLFSSLPVMCIYMYMKLSETPSAKAVVFMNFIAFLGVVHIALFDIAFNDRFGIYAWFYYPVMVALVVRAVVEKLRANNKTAVLPADAP